MAYQGFYLFIKKNAKKIAVTSLALLSLLLLFLFSRSSFDKDKERYLDILKKYNSNLDHKHKTDIQSRIDESKARRDAIDEAHFNIVLEQELIESRRNKDEQLKDVANDLRRAGY